MRTSLSFVVTGRSKEEIELNLKKRIAKYLNTEIDNVEEKVEIEMIIFVGEEGPMELVYSAECKVKVKSHL